VRRDTAIRTQTVIDRRTLVRTAGAGLVAMRTPVARLFGSGDTDAAATCASLSPAKTIRPYFVEEKLDRADLTTDPATSVVVAGAPPALRLGATRAHDRRQRRAVPRGFPGRSQSSMGFVQARRPR
jgi:hypothetical protein